ncbi:ParA family protein [Paeniglutamicibacter sp.]|jgi:chromosome partitioning protein|uniref:ParA family protein n=1 Tax=Paeniglutamicibacter sp. TaxID=1934391 RepID=UPI003988FB3D
MQTVMVYSEAGGVSKTTTAVSLAMVAAEQGMKVLLVDLDPRAATTKWTGVEPTSPGLDVGAILADEDPEGWAEDIAVQSLWSNNLRVIPSSRSVSNREKDSSDHLDVRLRTSLIGCTADLVVIDCPNRQGGPLTQSALNAADTVLYAARPTTDGLDGFEGAQLTIQKFLATRKRLGVPATLVEAGIVVGGYKDTVTPRAAIASVEVLRETGLLLTPLIPERTIVNDVRLSGEWYGNYRKGAPVLDAYKEVAKKVLR